jgi:hypothetical protein
MIAIISDIHGNFAALESVLSEIDRMHIRQVACLGDVAGYYSAVNECIEALRARDVVSLMGNHDYYLTSGSGCPRSASANRCLYYQRQTIREENLQWLAASPVRGVAEGVSIVHGGWNDPIDEYLYDVPADYFTALDGPAIPTYRASGDSTARCTAIPGRSDSRATAIPGRQFSVWTDGEPTVCRVAYDIDATCRLMKQVGFEPHFYENLYRSTRIGARR